VIAPVLGRNPPVRGPCTERTVMDSQDLAERERERQRERERDRERETCEGGGRKREG